MGTQVENLDRQDRKPTFRTAEYSDDFLICVLPCKKHGNNAICIIIFDLTQTTVTRHPYNRYRQSSTPHLFHESNHHFIWQRAVGLLPGELNQAEVSWLASPQQHLPLMTRRRAAMIVNRVRLFASLFAILTSLDCD